SAETHTTLAVLWSGPGLAQSVVLLSSLGLSGSRSGSRSWDGDWSDFDPSGVAETVISARSPRIAASGCPHLGRGPSLPGQRVGRYRLIERLGRGCQGDVWRAIAVEPDSDPVEVALKLLPASLARDPRRLAQFRREAERRARLAVPSVLPTSEF